jgi:phage terminase large subunit-like protein
VRVRAFVPEEEGEYIDQEEVRMYLLGLANLYKIQNVAYDPAYMTLMAQQLAESGLPMTPYPQSPERMSVATETFQNLILSERLRHGNERTFDEQVANLGTVQTDRGVRISKRKSGGRIDAITAAVMALDVCFGDADPPQQDFAELT